jgi:hypothetical protein
LLYIYFSATHLLRFSKNLLISLCRLNELTALKRWGDAKGDRMSEKSFDFLADLMNEIRHRLDELERKVASLELELLRKEQEPAKK